ncbi:hypothetical protein CXB51_002896 [Gossypium anomalum]|uniref:Rab-GAP TBC domain-containing protein n=1 Tax=Gossypium anomalum TaxID=47600 RepID=A0A8J5ZFT7_9ROSI|nr:hypothetical protein CXB51_002896 [Gossypium anomalum]
MPESILTFFQSVEPKRDTNGFAVRPQHIQTYRHYVNIYKKEEKERSEIWKVFFNQLAKHIEPRFLEKDDGKTSQVGDTELKSKASAEVKTKETLHAGLAKANEEATKLKEKVASEVQYKEAFQSNAIKVIEEVASLYESTETSQTEATKLNEEVSLERNREGDTPSAKPNFVGPPKSKTEEPFSAYSTESEKEVQFAEETRTCKVERWVKTRPAICVIENMMGSRVKKRKNMENMNMNESRDHLPSIKEARFPDGESDDEFEENVCVNEIPTGEENNAGNEASQEPPFPWKEELESLVLGGVPKDLRGEIWQAFVGVKARRVERYYEDLLAHENYDDDQHRNSSSVFKRWRKQIEKDLPRTFPGHPTLNDNGRDSLRRLLLAYARHNPSVGYCQGYNLISNETLKSNDQTPYTWPSHATHTFGVLAYALALWKELDYYQDFQVDYTEDAVKFQQLVQKERAYNFLARLKTEYDQIWVQVLEKICNLPNQT